MRRVIRQSIRIERLDERRLMSGSAARLPGDGVDLQFLSNPTGGTTPVISESPEMYPRVELDDGFRWFDSTSNRDLIQAGAHADYIMVDGWNVWPRDEIVGAIRTGEPSEVNTRWLANHAVTQTDTLVVNIENWAMDIRYYTQAQVNQSIQRFENIIRWLREEQPDLKIGIYSLFPISDLYASVQYEEYGELAVDPVSGFWYRGALPSVSNNFARLQNGNAFLASLASKVDFVMPAIYTSSPNIDHWRRYATSTVQEARRYGKPVIPFLMPTYHQAANLNQAVMPADLWQFQLNLMPQIAEGAIIWTDPYAPTGSNQYWISIAVNTINGTGGGLTAGAGSGSPDGRNDVLDIRDRDDDRFSDILIEELL